MEVDAKIRPTVIDGTTGKVADMNAKDGPAHLGASHQGRPVVAIEAASLILRVDRLGHQGTLFADHPRLSFIDGVAPCATPKRWPCSTYDNQAQN